MTVEIWLETDGIFNTANLIIKFKIVRKVENFTMIENGNDINYEKNKKQGREMAPLGTSEETV